MASYRQQVVEGRSTAHLALEAVEQVDRERADQAQRVADAEAVASEHDVAEEEVQTKALVSTFRDRIARADSISALAAALGQSLAGLWASVDDADGDERLLVEFGLGDISDSERDYDRLSYLIDHADAVGRQLGAHHAARKTL
jgi:hypothetical protein